MDRIAPDHSIVCLNRNDTALVHGKFYVFAEDDEASFKRYFSRPDRFQPYSTNPDHPTIFASDNTRVIGRVWRVINDLR